MVCGGGVSLGSNCGFFFRYNLEDVRKGFLASVESLTVIQMNLVSVKSVLERSGAEMMILTGPIRALDPKKLGGCEEIGR